MILNIKRPLPPRISKRSKSGCGRSSQPIYPLFARRCRREEAVALFKGKGETYKVELINDLPADVKTVSLYTQGDYIDLVPRTPHPLDRDDQGLQALMLPGPTGAATKRTRCCSAFTGPALPTKRRLTNYLTFSKRRRRGITADSGRELDLFQINDEAGPGLIIFHPKGMLLRYIIEEWERKEHLKRGYDMVMGPQILKVDLWKRSGHFDHYRENMYFTEVDEQAYGIKPMNCLSHMLIYKSKIRSYRDLPLTIFRTGHGPPS